MLGRAVRFILEAGSWQVNLDREPAGRDWTARLWTRTLGRSWQSATFGRRRLVRGYLAEVDYLVSEEGRLFKFEVARCGLHLGFQVLDQPQQVLFGQLALGHVLGAGLGDGLDALGDVPAPSCGCSEA